MGAESERTSPPLCGLGEIRHWKPPGKGSYPCRRKKRKTMSYRSREKKRRAKLAIVGSKGRADRWYITPVRRHCCCNRCGVSLRAGDHDMVFRHSPKEIPARAARTPDSERISYRPSRRWDALRARELKVA
jgi:hypothetical protein